MTFSEEEIAAIEGKICGDDPMYARYKTERDRAAKLAKSIKGFLDYKHNGIGYIGEGSKHLKLIEQALAEYERDPATPTEDRTAAVLKALFDMRDAYNNKDGENPHGFELEALAEANRLLEGYYYTQAKSEVKP